MFDYKTLYNLVRIIEGSWSARQNIDWDQAEQIIRKCESIPAEDIAQYNLSDIHDIVAYSMSVTGWDSRVVRRWPVTIMECIDRSRKTYKLGAKAGKWELVSIGLNGAEKWVGDFDNATLGNVMLKELNSIGAVTASQGAYSKLIKVKVICPNDFAANVPNMFSSVLNHELIQRIQHLQGLVNLSGVCCVEESCTIGDWVSETTDKEILYSMSAEKIHVSKGDFWFSCHPTDGKDTPLSTSPVKIRELSRASAYICL